MKVLLIVYDNDSYIHSFPMGLGYIASTLRNSGHDITIYNQDLYHYSESHLIDYLTNNNFDIVGIGIIAGYYQYQKILKISEAINFVSNRPFYILGGHGPSPEPGYFLRKTGADAVIIGEGEISTVNLLSALENNVNLSSVDGIAYLSNGKLVVTKPQELIKDIDSIPFPAWDLFPMDYYSLLREPKSRNSDRCFPVLSGRGCTFRCNFCLPKGTLILMEDLTYIPIENIKMGDIVVGITKDDSTFFRFERSKVINTFKRKDKIYKIETTDGNVFSTEEHPWLSNGDRWRETKKFVPGQFLRKVSTPIKLPKETISYKIGYIAGAFEGDGSIHKIFSYNDPWKYDSKSYVTQEVKLTGNYEMMDTVIKYANELEINLSDGSFNGGGWQLDSCVRSTKKEIVDKIKKAINKDRKIIENDEYKRGYLAGMYDADGSWTGTVRFHNKNERILNRISEYLHYFGFQTKLELYDTPDIALLGGLKKYILFFSLVNPKVENKKNLIFDTHLQGMTPILSIASGDIVDVYNLETSTGNFIADGFVTHNCYRMDKGFRPRSAESIIEEIEILKKKYRISYIEFTDELFMTSYKRTKELCRAFIDADLNIKWSCNGRLNYATPDVLESMKKAGCVFINYGIECMDDIVLKNMNKNLTTNQITKGIETTLAEGISPGFNIIFGNIGDNTETLKKDVDFLLKYDDHSQLRTIRPVTPYPGSPLYYYAIEKGLLKDVADFYENKHVNSDLLSVNFTDLPDEEFHKLLFEANGTLLENYYKYQFEHHVDITKRLYFEKDVTFRGFRQ